MLVWEGKEDAFLRMSGTLGWGEFPSALLSLDLSNGRERELLRSKN